MKTVKSIGDGIKNIPGNIKSGLSAIGGLFEGTLPDGGGGFNVSTSGKALENTNTENLRNGEASSIWLDFSPMMEVNTRSDPFNLVQGVEGQTQVLDNATNTTDNNKKGNQQSDQQKTLEADSTYTMTPGPGKDQTTIKATSTKTDSTKTRVVNKNINDVPLNY